MHHPLMAQSSKEDSLTILLVKTQNPNEKVNILNELSVELLAENRPNDALTKAQQGLAIAQQVNYQAGMGTSLINVGNAYLELAEFSKTIDYYNQSYELYQTSGNQEGEAEAVRKIGNAYFYLGEYDKALSYYLDSEKIAKRIGNKHLIASALTEIGYIYIKQKLYDRALDYFRDALKIAQEADDSSIVAANLYNQAEVYETLGDYNQAITYYKQGLEIDKENGNLRNVANSMIGLGRVFVKLNQSNEALENYLRALQIQEQIQDSYGQVFSNIGIADVYGISNNEDRAIDYYQKALKLALTLNAKEQILEIYQKLSLIHEKNSEIELAFKYHKLFKIYSDSIYDQNRLHLMAEMNARYDLSSKNDEIKSLKDEKERGDEILVEKDDDIARQRMFLGLIIAGLLLVAVIAYSFYRDRKKQREANEVLSVKNQEIQKKNEEIEQKNEEIQRAYRQLTDSLKYAQAIQDSILPGDVRMSQILPEHFAIYRAKDIVSGDFYWVDEVDDKVFIAVVDCTGHGIPGAFMSMIGNTLLNEIINQKRIFSPADVLEQLDEGFQRTLLNHKQEIPMGMEVCLCVLEDAEYDENKMILTYAGAKRPLFYVQNSEMTELKGDRSSIGFEHHTKDKKVFNNRCLEVQKGGHLYLTTDGLIDQDNNERRRFGSRRLRTLLQSDFSEKPIQEQQMKLEQILDNFRGNAVQRDDITVVGIKL